MVTTLSTKLHRPGAHALTDFRVRTATADDLGALYDLAVATGGGFTTLPADRAALARKLERHRLSLGQIDLAPRDQVFLLLLENAATGEVVGTANLHACLGQDWPFYSYRVSRVHQTSREVGKKVSADVLLVVNEFDGATEVGGLFLRPDHRRGGLGRLLARSRYLFIAQHRACFAERVVAEMRGYHEPAGRSAFWDAVGRHFFDMDYLEADHLNAVHGNQFISDLMPRYPVYIRMLPAEAQAVIGQPHRDGRRAYDLLLEEGFRDEGYVDIFDAGPTLWAPTDELRAVRDSGVAPARLGDPGRAPTRLIAAGRGVEFRVACGGAAIEGEELVIAPAMAATLGVGARAQVRHVSF